MYMKDFQIKLAGIENQLEWHANAIGEQILSGNNSPNESLNLPSIKQLSPKKQLSQKQSFGLSQRNKKSIYYRGQKDFSSYAVESPTMNIQLQKPDYKITQIDTAELQKQYKFSLRQRSLEINQDAKTDSSRQDGGDRLLSSQYTQEQHEQGDIVNLKEAFRYNNDVLSKQKAPVNSRVEESRVFGQIFDGHLLRDQNQTVVETRKEDPTSIIEHYERTMCLSFNKVVQDVKEDLQIIQIQKNYNFPEVLDRLRDDPKLKYFIECQREHIGVLPILQKIKNKTLNLKGYTISSGIAKSLGLCIKKSDNILNKIILDSNGLKDEDLQSILTGLSRLQEIKSLIYINNEFGIKSAEQLSSLLGAKGIPNHFEELRIMNCKVTSKALEHILDAMISKSYLKRLSLVNAHLTHVCLSKINQFMNGSRYLMDLDLSWNGLKSTQMDELMTSIGENRQLQYLNLSWNNLMGNSEKEEASEEIEQTDQTLFVEMITKFIKYNKNLLHLDLSYTGLTEEALRVIGTSVKRGRSIISLHLSGNPGVTDSLKAYLIERIRCANKKNTFFESSSQHSKKSFDQAVSTSIERCSPMKLNVKMGVESSQIAKQKRQVSLAGSQPLDIQGESSMLILQRWVGHKEDIPGSGQWQMLTQKQDQCWVCDKQIYSIVMWTRSIGQYNQVELDFEDKERFQEQIKIINHSNPLMINRDNKFGVSAPLICGSFTDWQYQHMITLDSFCQLLDKTESRQFIKHMKDRGHCSPDVKQEEDLDKKELLRYEKLKRAHQYKRLKNWRQTLVKSLKYNKRPFIVNAHLLPSNQNVLSNASNEPSTSEEDDEGTMKANRLEEIWVLPLFMSHGKHSYFVNFDGENYAHKLLAPFREDEIPISVKASKSNTVDRRFKKDTSVFRDWREDTPGILIKAADMDQKEWKALRLIKDSAEVERCWDIIWKNFERLKELFITLACKSNFPCIALLDFCIFAEQCKFLDKNVGLATIDRLFIATNVEIVANDENPAKELQRFELFEILLRISNAKYRETGICPTFSSALDKLLKENVFPNYKIHPWQEFREKELWTVDVNDVLEANLEGLKKVYAMFFDPRKKYMSMQETIELMIKMTPLQMTEKDAIFCHGMCKMTVVNEAEESTVKYKRLQFVELLELMGRIAEVKFRGTDMESTLTLAQKIEFVLDDVLQLVEVKRKDVKIVVDEHSESDDDY